MRNEMFKKSRWLIVIMLLTSITTNAQWTAVGGAGFTADSADYTTMVQDGSGALYVGFQDDANSYKATVMKYNGSSWTAVGTAGFSSGATSNNQLAIDGNDTLYMAFADGANSNKTTVMKYNGTNWVLVGTAGFSLGTATYLQLTIDGSNTLYIGYRDDGSNTKGTVMKYNGSSWVNVGTAGFSAGSVNSLSLAIDGSGTPYVAYADDPQGNKTTVMKYNGSSWVNVGTAGFSAGTASSLSLKFSSNGTPYLAFKDAGNNYKGTVMTYNGSSWVNVGSAGFTVAGAGGFSLYIDVNDVLYTGYFDNVVVGTKAVVSKFNGINWVAVGNVGFSAGVNISNTLIVQDNGVAYLGYTDWGNGGKATVMKYPLNIWNGSTWSDGAPNNTSLVEIKSNTAPTTFTCNDLTVYSGFALNTGTNNVVTIHGDLTNNGDGVTGTGTLTFTKSGTSTLTGDTVAHEGAVVVESGCTLATSNKLRLKSNATNTGRIGNSAGTITGNVYAQRYMPGKRCFRFYGHPFSSSIALSQLTDEIDVTGSGGATNGFTTTITNSSSAFWFDVTAADNTTASINPGWKPFTSATSASWDRHELLLLLVRGAKGEGLDGQTYSPSAATFEGAGVVNQGTQVVTLTKGTGSNFVTCGNPFPSGVQMNTVAKGSHIGANYYVWDATSGAKGAYVTNAFTLSYILPAYGALMTTATANSSNTLTFEEADKVSGGAGLFKTTGQKDWVELYIYDSTTKWDRLLIHLNSNGMDVEDKLDGKKLDNPGLDFYTVSKDGAHLAVDVRPYDDKKSIPIGLTAYNRYNRYVIKTGLFDIPIGTKLILHDKYLNKQEELKEGFEYWFDVTADSLSQGDDRFEINMVGKPTGLIEAMATTAQMQLIPNPAKDEVKLSFSALSGAAHVKLVTVTGQVLYNKTVNAGKGSITIPLTGMPPGLYIVSLERNNTRFSEKLIIE